MLRIFNIFIGLIGLQLIGCQINESDSSQKVTGVIQGKIEDREVTGSGIVFLKTDSNYHFRGLLGAPNDHISVDISLSNLDAGSFALNPDINSVSMVRIIGMDAVGAVYGLNSLDQNTLVLKGDVKSGKITGTLFIKGYNKEDETSLKVELSFTIPVATSLKNEWDCDFSGEYVKGCHFLQ